MVLLHLLLGLSTRIFFPGAFKGRKEYVRRPEWSFSAFARGRPRLERRALGGAGVSHRRRLRPGLVGWGVTSRQRLHER